MPAAVPSLPTVFQRHQDAINTTRIDAAKEDRAQDYSYDAMDAIHPLQKFQIVNEALTVYPLSTEAWGVLGYHYLNSDDKSDNLLALEAFETAVRVARKIHPGWGIYRTEPLEWGYIEHRPYLRAVQGLALTLHDLGRLDRAIETAELLVRWKRRSLDDYLVSWYLEAFRLEDAERFLADILSDEDRCLNCGLGYGKFLLEYLKLQKGKTTCADLDQALFVALQANPFVPAMLMTQRPPNAKPDSHGLGDKEEATIYVFNNWKLWKSIPGATSWLNFTIGRCGKKPDEQTLVRLLRHHLLLIKLPDQIKILGTQCQDKMLGTALPDFFLHPAALKPHQIGNSIPVQRHEYGLESNEKWASFRYDNVVSVPFWNVYLVCGSSNDDNVQEEEATKEEATATPAPEPVKCGKCKAKVADTPDDKHMKCSKCSVTAYCSRACQVADWKKHKKECKKLRKGRFWGQLDKDILATITGFLTIQERAFVSRLNKAWLEAAHTASSLHIDPDDVGTDMNTVLAFLGTKFRDLKEVSIHIDQSYFLGNGYSGFQESKLQLHGHSLRQFFLECPRLRSIEIAFDDCCEVHAKRILLDESGFDSVAGHDASLENLALSCTYFDDVPSLALRLQPFVNLKCLRLTWTRFNRRTALGRGEKWLSAGALMSVIANMKQLRNLAIYDHGLTDSDLQGLRPILGKLRILKLEGHWGDGRGPGFLTDTSLELISQHARKLQSLGISCNRRFTIGGIRLVVSSCPLRELVASEAGLSSEHLVEIVKMNPKLRFIRFGEGIPGRGKHPQEALHLRDATWESGGRTLFMNYQMYEPSFSATLLRRHKASHELLKRNKADASNGWNEWEGLMD